MPGDGEGLDKSRSTESTEIWDDRNRLIKKTRKIRKHQEATTYTPTEKEMNTTHRPAFKAKRVHRLGSMDAPAPPSGLGNFKGVMLCSLESVWFGFLFLVILFGSIY